MVSRNSEIENKLLLIRFLSLTYKNILISFKYLKYNKKLRIIYAIFYDYYYIYYNNL